MERDTIIEIEIDFGLLHSIKLSQLYCQQLVRSYTVRVRVLLRGKNMISYDGLMLLMSMSMCVCVCWCVCMYFGDVYFFMCMCVCLAIPIILKPP